MARSAIEELDVIPPRERLNDKWGVRRRNELDTRESPQQVFDDASLPLGVEMKVDLVDLHHTRCFQNGFRLKGRIQRGTPDSDVGRHGKHVAISCCLLANVRSFLAPIAVAQAVHDNSANPIRR
jgi:hypothetical protein